LNGTGLRVLLILLVLPAVAGAQVGKRNFIEPLIVEDPNPGNQLDLIPDWVAVAEGSNFSFNFTLEKTLSQNLSIELGNAWNDPSCNPDFICLAAGSSRRGRSRNRQANSNDPSQQLLTGFDDLEVLPKYAFYRSDEHEMRLAIGVDTFVPIGNKTAGATTHASIGPIFMFAKGLGDIPNHGFEKYLRPLALQGELAYLIKVSGQQNDDAIADWDISYELFYLTDNVRDFGLPAIVNNLAPFAEFSYQQIVNGPRGRTQPNLVLLPGLAYVAPTYQLSLATEFALNQATIFGCHAAVFGMLSLTLDQLFPQAARTLF
jgi:hypothetical protein